MVLPWAGIACFFVSRHPENESTLLDSMIGIAVCPPDSLANRDEELSCVDRLASQFSGVHPQEFWSEFFQPPLLQITIRQTLGQLLADLFQAIHRRWTKRSPVLGGHN